MESSDLENIPCNITCLIIESQLQELIDCLSNWSHVLPILHMEESRNIYLKETEKNMEMLAFTLNDVVKDLRNGTPFMALKILDQKHIQNEMRDSSNFTRQETQEGFNVLQKKMDTMEKNFKLQKEEIIAEVNALREEIMKQEETARDDDDGKTIQEIYDNLVKETKEQCKTYEDMTENKDLQVDTKLETEINARMEMYLETRYEQLEQESERWKEKYETEMKEKSDEVYILNELIKECDHKIVELTPKCEELEAIVEADHQRKQILIEKAEVEVQQLCSLVKIQSWWRGIMVRKQLGKYSKKKRNKKKKGQKEIKTKKTAKKSTRKI